MAENTEIFSNFLVPTFCGKAQSLQNFHTRGFGDITVIYAVVLNTKYMDRKKDRNNKLDNPMVPALY